MKQYSLFLTLWKAFWTWAASVGVLGAGAVLAIDLPKTADPNLWIAVLITLVPAVIKVIENVRKNYRNDGEPMWKWPFIGAVMFLLISGCALNRHYAMEETYYENGQPQSTLVVKGDTVSTWGSETENGSNDFSYSADAQGGFDITAGNAVERQQAGEATNLFMKMFEYMMENTEPDPEQIEEIIESYLNAAPTN